MFTGFSRFLSKASAFEEVMLFPFVQALLWKLRLRVFKLYLIEAVRSRGCIDVTFIVLIVLAACLFLFWPLRKKRVCNFMTTKESITIFFSYIAIIPIYSAIIRSL